MISKRLNSIVSYVKKKDCVADVGCDHGLLSIYLYEHKLCKRIIASDVNQNALANAEKNIQKKKFPIETILSDGLQNIPMNKVDTIIISGMGTNTILHILKDTNSLKNIHKLIIQSNNDRSYLRKEMNILGFHLEDETVVYENKKYYVTMLYKKIEKQNTKLEIKYGIIKKENKEYYSYLVSSYIDILHKIPRKKVWTRYRLKKEIKQIKNFI